MKTKKELELDMNTYKVAFEKAKDKHAVVRLFELFMEQESEGIAKHQIQAARQLYAMRETLVQRDNIKKVLLIIHFVLSVLIGIMLILYLPIWPFIGIMVLWIMKHFIGNVEVEVNGRE